MPVQHITIKLEALQFFSFHGLYEEEKTKGGNFTVNLSASFSPATEAELIKPITDISQTVDYAQIYAVIARIMSVPHELLETVAMEIAATLQIGHPELSIIEVAITKNNPPIPGMAGSSTVHYCWKR